MDFRFLHFYPDLMSLYGSYANVSVLKRLLERMGHTVTVEPVRPGGGADIPAADFLYMGAGTERASLAALEDFRRFGDAVKAAAEDGAAMLFAGTAMELLGATITEADGSVYKGAAIASFASARSPVRRVGDVYGHTDLFSEAVVGFMNKCASISGVETPLLTETGMGYGNGADRGPEGYHRGHVFASELTGPLLVKNPRLLETVARILCEQRGAPWPEEPPVDSWAERSYQVTEKQLRLLLPK